MELSILLDLFEALTIFCFGLSWPISIRKSYISRTAKGKSLFFEILVIVGYLFGIARKTIQVSVLGYPLEGSGTFGAVVFVLSFLFYVLNCLEIIIDVALYFRNTKLDKLRDEGKIV